MQQMKILKYVLKMQMHHLSNKNVAGSTKGLCSCGSKSTAHDVCDFTDDDLHDAQVIEHGDDTAKENNHWQHLNTSKNTVKVFNINFSLNEHIRKDVHVYVSVFFNVHVLMRVSLLINF